MCAIWVRVCVCLMLLRQAYINLDDSILQRVKLLVPEDWEKPADVLRVRQQQPMQLHTAPHAPCPQRVPLYPVAAHFAVAKQQHQPSQQRAHRYTCQSQHHVSAVSL